MIVHDFVRVLIMGLQAILNLLPDIPDLPPNLVDGAYAFIDLIFDNIGLLGLFIPISTIKVVVPLIIVIINFDRFYRIVIWALKKIPIFGIEA